MDKTNGQKAPQLSLAGVSGPRAVGAPRGPQALFFFKVSCPACPLAAPAVERLRQAYPGLDVVAVSQDGEPEAKDWARQHGLDPTALALDGEGHQASAAFGLATVPTLVLLDGQGTIAAVQEGWSRDGYDALAKEAARLVGAPPVAVAPAEGPAFRPG